MDKRLFLICICLTLSGCGYHLATSHDMPLRCKTVSVPYVIGDGDGGLTSAVVHTLSQEGFSYRKCGGDVALHIEIIEVRDENIGFRFDRQKGGELTNSLIPAETRLTATAEVQVIDCCKGCQLIPPFCVTTSVDFDHEYYTSRNGVNTFSLGQLSDIDAARDVAWNPLQKKLAECIVDHLVNMW